MKVLMVCLGNICRSPMAEGILRSMAVQKGLDIEVDSCGTASYHVGQHPDPRSVSKSMEHNIDISSLYGRQFGITDFDEFDFILTMDTYNYDDIRSLARNDDDLQKVKMILNYSHPEEDKDVPDPYYGGAQGFENVFQLLDKASEAFIRNHFNE